LPLGLPAGSAMGQVFGEPRTLLRRQLPGGRERAKLLKLLVGIVWQR
jgi:hypothetical protein